MNNVGRTRDIYIDQGLSIFDEVGYERNILETEIDYSEGSEVEVLLPSTFGDTIRLTFTREFVRRLYMGFLENDYPPESTGFDRETDKLLYGMFVYREMTSGGTPDQDALEEFLEERGYDGQLFVNYAYHYLEELDSKFKGCVEDPGEELSDQILDGNFEYPEFKADPGV
tara:strand:+ start:490 stop:999 length:510 start_codon:yes stop_codon:yes gene_type:complete